MKSRNEYMRKYRELHKEELRQYRKSKDKEYKARNKEKIKLQREEYYKHNKDVIVQKSKKWQEDNKEYVKTYSKKYLKTYPEKNRAKSAKRLATKLNQTPKWADLKAIEEFYKKCPPGYHVDHIVPLRGKNVRGLHVLENLQYLPASENLRKSNKY